MFKFRRSRGRMSAAWKMWNRNSGNWSSTRCSTRNCFRSTAASRLRVCCSSVRRDAARLCWRRRLLTSVRPTSSASRDRSCSICGSESPRPTFETFSTRFFERHYSFSSVDHINAFNKQLSVINTHHLNDAAAAAADDDDNNNDFIITTAKVWQSALAIGGLIANSGFRPFTWENGALPNNVTCDNPIGPCQMGSYYVQRL